MLSVWKDTSKIPAFAPLQGALKTQVLIIGGGMAGVLCAYFLQQAGVDYALLEAKSICSGATQNTTAKITPQHGLIYHKLQNKYGTHAAAQYLRANENALAVYRQLCGQIACDFTEKDAFVYSLDGAQKIEDELKALQALHSSAQLAADLPLPFAVDGAIRFPRGAQFNPLQFVSGIVQGLHIYEHSFVTQLTEHSAVTEHGTVTAEKIIVATHFPFLNKHGSYFLKLYQHRSYVLGLANAPDVQGMYVDEAQDGLSFRNYNGLLLLGGGAHRTGKKGGNWQALQAFAQAHYPQAQQQYRWAAQDCMTLDGVPYIGRYAKSTPNLYVATGFNKWGMTTAMAAALLLTDLVQEKENEFAHIFAPSRNILTPQLAVNAFEAVTNMLTFSKKRCPHLGCALKWNPAEHTWDCPCHGSRFGTNGTLLDNPAMRGLK